MTPIEIETTVTDDIRREWICIRRLDAPNGEAWISMSREYEGYDGKRRTDPEAGLCFDAAQLGDVIAALTQVANHSGSDNTND